MYASAKERENWNRRTYITTKRSIKNNILILEVRIDITPTPSIKGHNRCSPITSHRLPAGDIGRDCVSGEEPDINPRTLPLHSVHTASIVVEGVPVRVGSGGCDATAGIAVILVAVGILQYGPALRASRVDAASCGGVERDGVGTSEVYAFYDVDFAAVWPAGAKEPECWPDAADTSRPRIYI